MSFRTILGSVFGVLVLLTGRLLVAQISGCHIELSDINPQITQIVLVNDSNQPIEAFRISQQCKSGAPYSRNDALDGPDTMGAIDGENGSPSRTIGVEPGGKAGLVYNGGNHDRESDDARREPARGEPSRHRGGPVQHLRGAGPNRSWDENRHCSLGPCRCGGSVCGMQWP